MNDANLLKLAGVLAVLCGAIELYESLAFVEDIKAGAGNAARTILIHVIPIGIALGGLAMIMGRLIIGAGVVINGIGIQHCLIDIGGRHFIALGLGLAAVAVAMYVQRRRDIAGHRDVISERVTVLPT
jgi:hypothetical protein